MKKLITSDDRYIVYKHLIDNYSKHFLAQNLAQELPDEEIKYYLKEIKEIELE